MRLIFAASEGDVVDDATRRQLFAASIAEALAGFDPARRELVLDQQWRSQSAAIADAASSRDGVIVVDGAAVGRVVITSDARGETLFDLFVRPEIRGRGIATEALSRLITEARTSGRPLALRVRHGNPAAALYSRLGFVITGASAIDLSMVFTPPARPVPVVSAIGAGYLPVRVAGAGLDAAVTFADVGRSKLDAPFFVDATAAARSAPTASAAPIERTLREMIAASRYDDAVPVGGLVFHVSRCGSSLAMRAIQSDPHTFGVAEADPIDAELTRLSLERDVRVEALRAMVAAYARRRDESTRRLVVKLDAWHLARADVIVDAFPDVPKLVLIREPAAVVASHRARRGSHVVPGLAPARTLAIDPSSYAVHDLDAYGCRVLEALYRHAHALLARPEVRFLDHAAMTTESLAEAARFVGCDVDADVEARIAERSAAHAKDKNRAFDATADAARAAALPAESLTAVATIARPGYDALVRGIDAGERAIASRSASSTTQSTTR